MGNNHTIRFSSRDKYRDFRDLRDFITFRVRTTKHNKILLLCENQQDVHFIYLLCGNSVKVF